MRKPFKCVRCSHMMFTRVHENARVTVIACASCGARHNIWKEEPEEDDEG